jgi:ketosteroid isomerase-like protein
LGLTSISDENPSSSAIVSRAGRVAEILASVSDANQEFLRRAIGAYQERDFAALEAMVTADFEFVSMLSEVSGQAASYRGPDAWQQYFEAMESVWDDWHVGLDEIHDGGETGVVGIFTLVGTGRSSGIRAEQTMGIVYEFRDGKMCRARSYIDPSAALAAVAREV